MELIYYTCMGLVAFVILYAFVSAYVQTRRTRSQLEREIKENKAASIVADRAVNMNKSALQYIDMFKRGQISYDRTLAQSYTAKGYTDAFLSITKERKPFLELCEELQAIFRGLTPDDATMAIALGKREFCRDWLFSLNGSKGLQEFYNMFGEV